MRISKVVFGVTESLNGAGQWRSSVRCKNKDLCDWDYSESCRTSDPLVQFHLDEDMPGN